jgi:site-specific recombinase XerD
MVVGRTLPTWLTLRERERLTSLDLSPRDRAILAIFLYAGLRCNELRMLDVQDLDFETGTIYVRFAKRDKQRLIPLHAEASAALKTFLAGRETGPVFGSLQGERISNRRLRSLIKDLGQRAGIHKDLHPHALRHTFAVALLEAGVDLEMIKELLGHESILTTTIYLHCTTQRKRAAVDRL